MPKVITHHPDLDGPRPPCFNPDQWATHVRCEKELVQQGIEPAPAGFCQGCTPRYRDKMVARGTCRHPDVVFTVDDEGGFEGHRIKGVALDLKIAV